jgi:hypothetical protein
MTPIEQYRAAGFSDKEIGEWAAGERETYRAAGFTDPEIDEHLGGPQPKPSPSFFERLRLGTALFGNVADHPPAAPPETSMGEYGPGRFLIGLWKGLTTPGGELKETFADASPGEALGGLVGRIPAGQIIEQLRQGGAQVQRAVEQGELASLPGTPLAPGGVPASAVEMVGNAMLGITPPVTRTPGGQLVRIERSPTGGLSEVPLGELPRRGDFADAATAVAGRPHPEVQNKIERLWDEHGIHPAEAAHDAARDPTIKQDLLSTTPELPRRYVPIEEQSKAAAAPAEAPAPAVTAQIPSQIRAFAPDELRSDAQRFQFNEGGDAFGVTDRLQGVTQWDPLKAGLSVVFEDRAGEHFIADGHQRLGLAKRINEADPAQAPKLNAWVLREADGFSEPDVRALTAAKNIAEGTGTAVDAAKVLRDRPDLMESLPPRSEIVRQARGLMNLGPEAFGKVVNDVAPPNHAAIVGRLVPDDPKLQNALIDLLAKTKPENAVQAESIVRSGIEAGTHTETQATLFGDQELVSSLYADRARILDNALKQLRRDRTVFQSIVNNDAIIRDIGSELATDANAARASVDGHAIQLLQTLANRRGALSDVLSDLARTVASGERSPANATRDFVAEIRRQAQSGDLARAADGGDGGAVGAARPGGRGAQAAPEPELGPRDVSPATETRAAEQTRAAIERPDPDLFFAPDPNAPPVGMALGAPRPPRTPAEQTILDRINVGGRDQSNLTWSRFYTNVFDRLHPIEEAVAATGEALPTSQHPYRLARLMAGNPGRAQHWIEHGQVDFATGRTIGPSMREIVAPVQNDLDGLRAFGAAVRTLELENRGIKSGLNISAAREVAAAGIDKYGPVMAQLIQYQNNLAKYLRDAGVLSQDGYTAMLDANRLYIPFYRIFGDEAGAGRGAGGSLQASNPIHRIKGSERDVVDPLESIVRNTHLYLQMAERNRVGTSLVDVLSRHGTATPPRSPTVAVPATQFPAPAIPPVRQTPGTPGAALEQAVHQLLEQHGLNDNLFDFITDAATLKLGEISIFRNGKRETWQVGRELADAMHALDSESTNTILRMLAMPARGLRAGATLTPDFAARNIVRDFSTAFIQTGTGVFTPVRTALGFFSAVFKDEAFRDWLKSGGANSHLVALDRRYLQESLRTLEQETGLMSRGFNVIRHPIDGLRAISELSENMTRLGEFRAVRRSELTAGATPKEAAEAAAFASREVTIDFARAGAKTRAMNMITAFFNAQLQGTDRLVRAFRDHPVGTSLKVAGGITLPSVLLWFANRDDPRVQELPQWQRDLFWVWPTDKWIDSGPAGGNDVAAHADGKPFKYGGTSARVRDGRIEINNGTIWRIPKPFEAGVLFGSGAERLLDAFVAQNPDALPGLMKSIGEALVPSVIPTAAVPVLEQWANRSTFTDRNLIPAEQEKQLPEYQYTPYTTELSKALGQLISAFPGMREAAIGDTVAAGPARAATSPILIENYVRAWTGGLGMYALQGADAGLRKQGLLPDPPKPEDTLADIPVVKAFVVRYPSASTESLQRFYDEHERNKRYYDTWKAKAAEGDTEAIQRIQAAGGPRIFVQLDAIKQTLGEHSKLIRDIWKNSEIAPAEKRQLIDQLYYSEIQIAQSARETMRQVDTSLAR